jgi:hypothetical protein
MNRITATFLCLMLCLAGTSIPTASAASRLTTSSGTALTSCLQQEYLMRDTYQDIFAKYPALTTFGTVATNEVAMIGALKKLFAKYKITVPTDTQVSAANTIAVTVTSISNADAVAISLEQSTATLMTQQLQSADNQDVAGAVALIKTTSLGSHTSAFAAEQTTVATPPTTPTTPITPPATPAQVVALKTPVVPPPLTRPFPAPVTTRTVTVPASIDTTGASDASPALNAFIASVPDGSLINFPSATVYRIDKAIFLEHRHNIILDGNGCTLKYTSVTGTNQIYSFWYPEGADGSDIWIRNFVLIGSSPYPGVFTPGTSPAGGEGQHGVIITGKRFEVSGCTISAVWGDGFIVFGGASGVWIHDNHVISAGRQGLAVISATNVIAERNAFDKSGYCTFDVEPNYASESCTNIIFRNNTVGTYDYAGGRYFFGAGSTAGAVVDGIVVDGNTVIGGPLSASVQSVSAVRVTRITFTNNVGKVASSGNTFHFAHIDGLTVTGNVQPLTSGVLTSITDCTAVVTS